MSIGENIKSLRESRGLTQAQLGDAVGVSDKAVSTWESGKREPRMGAVEKLAAFFGLDKSELLFGAGYEKTAALAGDGLSPLDVKLIELLRCLTEDQTRLLLAQIETLLSQRG